jgi:molybdate-binding protein/DNA-binding transcriptional regulator YhcF (GntR family)
MMDEEFLYYRIADSIRREINIGKFKPGDALPSIRDLAGAWRCTIGTVQRAIRELESAGLVTTHAGKRTRVTSEAAQTPGESLQHANLIHRAETFLLESMTAGYTPLQVEDAMRVALNRWRSVAQTSPPTTGKTLRFSGSHDLAFAWIATHFDEIAPGYSINLAFMGSLAGLTSLQKGDADIAGMHLWDDRSNTYNVPYIQKYFSGEKLALVTLAHRRLGFIVKQGNPGNIFSIEDLARPEIRFVNRQEGSGTRVFLDAQLARYKLFPAQISGYLDDRTTHTEVAAAVAGSRADTGIGLEAAAKIFGLDFIPLTTERYDLVMRESTLLQPPMQCMLDWLKGGEYRALLNRLGGYTGSESGTITRVTSNTVA